MEPNESFILRKQKMRLRILLIAIAAIMILPMPIMAQQIVVGRFKDRTRSGVGRVARSALAKALVAKGADLVSYRRYLKKARRYGFRKSRAFSRRAIRKVSRRLNIDGVVTGRVARKGGRYWISVYLFGPNGKLWLKKKISSRRRRPKNKAMRWIADKVMNHLAPSEPEAEDDLVPTAVTDAGTGSVADTAVAEGGLNETATLTEDSNTGLIVDKGKAGGEWGDSLLDSSSGSDKTSSDGSATSTGTALAATFSSDSAAGNKTSSTGRDETFSDETYDSSVRGTAPSSSLRRAKVDNAWLTVGTGIHWRTGLKPLHTTDAFFGMRFQGRGFGGALWDKGWLNDIGVGFGLDFSVGLGYKYNDGSDKRFDASQTMWRLEGLYRLSFENPQAPDIIVKLGLNGIHSSLSDDAEFGLNASYVGPYLGMDVVWNLLHEQLRALFSLDVLMASAGGDLDAFAGGVRVFVGFQSIMLAWLQMDLGYELTYYGFDDSGTGSSSDTYHNIIIQLGYSLR